MKIRYIPAGVALLAGAITCLICIMRGYDVTYSLETLLLVLLIFTFIGIKSQQVIINIMHEQQIMEMEKIRRVEFLEAERLRKLQEGEDEEEEEEYDEDSDEREDDDQE
ncbi:MAG: hypothetical protein II838_00510 [Lachnospiraceae bacterium]|nr:hypothetical protein [Lachnospiraceae bacterium]